MVEEERIVKVESLMADETPARRFLKQILLKMVQFRQEACHEQKMKLVQAWIEIHREDLLVDWRLAVAGEPVFKIDPLK